MKTKLFFFIALMTFGFITTNYAQTSGQHTTVVFLNANASQTTVNVPLLQISVVIHTSPGTAEIEFVEVAGGGDAAGAPSVITLIANGPNCFSDSSGSIRICFADIAGNSSATAGRQKNRRVEMTIEFD